MVNELEAELSALIEQLRPGGPQAVCEALRARIAAVREAIAHRERNIQFVRDHFMDDE
jgi:predicted secreted Zn-dependent protease